MTLTIFDLETTGFSSSHDDILQIAAVKMRTEDGGIADSFSTFVKPRRKIPPHITKLTGITEADVVNACATEVALQDFSRFAGDDVLVAHCGLQFDMRFIRAGCTRLNLPERPVRVIDSRAFSRRLWGKGAGHSLDQVLARLGISAEGVRRHDARGDVHLLALAVHRLWARLTTIAEPCPVTHGFGVVPLV